MLGWILLGLASVAVGVIVISGVVDKGKLRMQMRAHGMQEAVITQIDACRNVVKLEDLNSDNTIEIQGDDLSYDLEEYDTIIA